ncbi:hypothetical protein TruAng_001072 [Truncatella angustata]|nr:hypothetical protein TruAng_001072 [Truncatella angustata]
MKYAFAAAAFAAVVSAQDISTIPSCAVPCVDASRSKVTSCTETDYKCLCDNITKIQGDATTCVITSCGADVAVSKVLPAVQAFCEAVEAGGSSSSSSAAATTSATSVAVTTSTAASTKTVATTSVAETTATATATSSATSSEGYSVSIPEGTTTVVSSTTYKPTTIASTITSKASNGTASATSTPTSVVTAGAALATAGSIGMLILGALAAL